MDSSEKHIVNLTYSDLLPKSACYLLLVVLSLFIASSLFSGDVCHCFSLKGDSAGYEKLRCEMVEKQIAARDIKDGNVLQAMRNVPRHLFVPEGGRRSAYGDFPLAIGYGQTISQPYIVALMTELLEPEEHDVALEVGTGSGYQAAVLSEIVKEVYTIEIIPPLGRAAEKRLKELAYENITVKVGDGYYGWEEYGPFDCIVVTAASDHIPPPLIKQLKKGGKMAIPVGRPFLVQHLMLVERSEHGDIRTRSILPVRFVPFRRKWK